MRYNLKILCILASVVLFASGCSKESEDRSEDLYKTVNFSLIDGGLTRSQFSSSLTDFVHTARVYVYNSDGLLYGTASPSSTSSGNLRMKVDDTYSVYVLANVSFPEEDPLYESEFIARTYDAQLNVVRTRGVPMCGSVVADPDMVASGEIAVELTRLFARVGLTIDLSGLSSSDMVIKSVTLHNTASRTAPFCGPYIEESSVLDGDFSTSADAQLLNRGGTAWFYVPENVQGVLLPGNTDPANKIPSNITGRKNNLCSYIRIVASHSGTYEGVAVSSQNVTYNIYLGQDNVTDFSVYRNQTLDLTLNITDQGMYTDGWKVSYGTELPIISYELEVSPSTASVYVGEQISLAAVYHKLVNGVRTAQQDVTADAVWTSSESGIATVSSGTVGGVAAGSCMVTAYYDGYMASSEILVENKITYKYRPYIVGFDSIVAGEDTQPYKLYYYTDTYTSGILTDTGLVAQQCTGTVTWAMANGSSYASVSSDGIIHGIAAGEARLKACMVVEGAEYYAYKTVIIQQPSEPGTDTGWEEGGDVEYE